MVFLIMHQNLSRESVAKLADKINTKRFVGLLCLSEALRTDRQSLEELCGSELTETAWKLFA